MYGLVPYNISDIQKGIQHGHAVTEYASRFGKTAKYLQWSEYHKTVVILNGGTTNTSIDRPGTINLHYNTLIENNVDVAAFFEEDLGDQMTAVAFIADERAFDNGEYPNLKRFLMDKTDNDPEHKLMNFIISHKPDFGDLAVYAALHTPELLAEWEETMGSQQNIFLKNFLSQFDLA